MQSRPWLLMESFSCCVALQCQGVRATFHEPMLYSKQWALLLLCNIMRSFNCCAVYNNVLQRLFPIFVAKFNQLANASLWRYFKSPVFELFFVIFFFKKHTKIFSFCPQLIRVTAFAAGLLLQNS